MHFKSIVLSPLLLFLAFGSVSAIALDTLTPTIVQAQVNPLAEGYRLLLPRFLTQSELIGKESEVS